jgi:hypothetical protein
MVEVRPATADEMILAFLQADIESPSDRGKFYAASIARIGADKATLIGIHADPINPHQNNIRRCLLGENRGYGWGRYLFVDFPDDTIWRLVTVTPTEVKGFKYANRLENWARISCGTRLVGDAVKNLDQEQNAPINGNVVGIATRVRGGEQFPALIAAQLTGTDELVLIEGHNRATAYAFTGLPDRIQVFIGSSSQMGGWLFF